MRIRLLVLLAVLACLAARVAAQTPTPKPTIARCESCTGRHNYALVGQSNIVGYSPSGWTPMSSSNSLWLWGNDYVWHQAPVEPIDCAIASQGSCTGSQVDLVSNDWYYYGIEGQYPGFGPSQQFGVELTRMGWEVGLIPCSLGNTALAAFQPAADHDDRSTLYGSCHHAINCALSGGATCNGQTPAGYLDGIIVFQGEADSTNGSWASQFTSLVSAWRADYGQNLKVCFAQVCNPNLGGGVIYAQQAAVSSSVAKMVATSDLGCGVGDGLHLSQSGYVALGTRFANCILSLH